MHVDALLLIGLPLLVTGAVFTVAARRESSRQRERDAAGRPAT